MRHTEAVFVLEGRAMTGSPYVDLRGDPHDPASFIVRRAANVPWVTLPLPPRLESWMGKEHPDQQPLREFIAATLPRIGPYIVGGRCGLELAVRLAENVPLTTGGRDLDNYMYPLVYRMAPELRAAVISTFVTKEAGTESRVRAGPVRDEPPPTSGWSFAGAEACGAAGSAAWRDLVVANLGPAPEIAAPSPVEMEITFRGARTAWHYDWKPTIDGLGPSSVLDARERHADWLASAPEDGTSGNPCGPLDHGRDRKRTPALPSVAPPTTEKALWVGEYKFSNRIVRFGPAP